MYIIGAHKWDLSQLKTRRNEERENNTDASFFYDLFDVTTSIVVESRQIINRNRKQTEQTE